MRVAAAVPAIDVRVDGRELERGHFLLAATRVSRRLSLPTQCELTFLLKTSGPASTGVAGALPIGAALEVAVIGDRGDLFVGEVTSHEWVYGGEAGPEFRVRGYDHLYRLRRRRRVHTRADVTAADLGLELAGEYGLAFEATEPGPRWPVLVQPGDSDLEHLRSVTEQCGLWFGVEQATLRLFTLEGVGEPVDLRPGETLLAARIDATDDGAASTVMATGWDPVTATELTGSARAARSGHGLPVSAGRRGAGERFLVDQHGPSTDHLVAAAQALLDVRAARAVTLSATVAGDGRLQPGRPVRVEGIDPDASGTFVLTETVHLVDSAGYRTELGTAPPTPAAPQSTAATTTVARVTSVDDPDGLGRVKVTLPGYDGVESDWRAVLTVGAGQGKGLVALPDVDDRVLLLLPHGDPAAAVVLGGLCGDHPPVDPGVVDGSTQRWSIWSRAGGRVILDDATGTVTVANGAGSTVVLAPDRVTIHATSDLVVQAPGKNLTFRAARIDFEHATELEEGPAGRAGDDH